MVKRDNYSTSHFAKGEFTQVCAKIETSHISLSFVAGSLWLLVPLVPEVSNPEKWFPQMLEAECGRFNSCIEYR